MSSLRDDWVAFALNSNSEPDIFFSCVFKTELVTRLQILIRGIDIRIGPTYVWDMHESNYSVEWAKKPGKLTAIKFVKDPNVPRDDYYKSSTVHVPEGLPPNSESRSTPRGRSSATTTAYSQPRTVPTTRPSQGRQANGYPQESRAPVVQQSRTQPPPPPPPPPPTQPPRPMQPVQPIYRAMFDFQGQTSSEMSFSKGEVLDILKKEGNGMHYLDYTDIRMVACKTRWPRRVGSSEFP
jgi:myosin I